MFALDRLEGLIYLVGAAKFERKGKDQKRCPFVVVVSNLGKAEGWVYGDSRSLLTAVRFGS